MNWTTTSSAFLSIWYRPRATIRRIVEVNPRDGVLMLVVVVALAGAVSGLMTRSPTAFTIAGKPIGWFSQHQLRLYNLSMLIGWPLVAIVFLYLNGALIRWSGSLLGGKATAVEVRAALAWSTIPAFARSVIYGIAAAAGLVTAFQPEPGRFPFHDLVRSSFQFGGVFVVLAIWQLIVGLKCIGEVHHFSAWKALGARIIAGFTLLGTGIATAGVLLLMTIPFLRH
jgi:Yip1-like protein